METDKLQVVQQAFDDCHAADPNNRELDYVRSIERWVNALIDNPDQALLLAARCQHFERWVISRDSYPKGRSAYLKWRRAVAVRQGERVAEIMQAHDCDPDLIKRVSDLVGKHVPRSDPDAQALEDAACLVFIEEQAADFAPKHPEKMPGIVQKTWNKMSPQARDAALAMDLPPAVQQIISDALSADGDAE